MSGIKQQQIKNSSQLLDFYSAKVENQQSYPNGSNVNQKQPLSTINNNMRNQNQYTNQDFEYNTYPQYQTEQQQQQERPSNKIFNRNLLSTNDDLQKRQKSRQSEQFSNYSNKNEQQRSFIEAQNHIPKQYSSPAKEPRFQKELTTNNANQGKYYLPEKTKDNSYYTGEEDVKRNKPSGYNIQATDENNLSTRNAQISPQQQIQEPANNELVNQLIENNNNKIQEYIEKYIKYDETTYRENFKKYQLTEDEVYEGEIQDEALNGQGVYRFKNGDVYGGQWINNKFNGFGIYISQNGDIYEGEFVDNFKEGVGKYTYSNGSSYEGQWENNQKHGEGKYYKQSNQCSYLGQFINGFLEQFGVIQDVNEKIIFTGIFIKGQPQLRN